ncbi:MAG: hypothetical protein CL916_11390, partial [Deltaproteobacteria bacterium]|nr:hypothetical protein [Deltaproteobacteria bacterium]
LLLVISLFSHSIFMLFFLSCTSTPITTHAMLTKVATDLALPVPEQLDPSMSVITFQDKRTLSLQRRYSDIEIRFFSGLSLEQAPTVQAASLTMHQIPLLNYELAVSKILVNPENAHIIFAHVLSAENMSMSILKKRIAQVLEEEKSIHEQPKAALQ